MIVHLKTEISQEKAAEIAQTISALHFHDGIRNVLVNSSKMKEIPSSIEHFVDQTFLFGSDLQLASRDYTKETRSFEVGQHAIGGKTNHTMLISGPCSVESWPQIEKCARFVKSLGLSMLRAGCFKPRTSPYTFQGLGTEGLQMLEKIRQQFGLSIISEVRDASHVEQVIETVDVIQVGAKAMYDHGILRKCGQANKPVLLKRGFGTTLQEFVQAAEFILSLGNDKVILCERGIRTFETKTRFTLDLCGVAYLKEEVNLPIFLDPSHAMGYAFGVPDLTRACVAMGVDGLLIESHPEPLKALSDASQQLDFESFEKMFKTLPAVAQAVSKKIV